MLYRILRAEALALEEALSGVSFQPVVAMNVTRVTEVSP